MVLKLSVDGGLKIDDGAKDAAPETTARCDGIEPRKQPAPLRLKRRLRLPRAYPFAFRSCIFSQPRREVGLADGPRVSRGWDQDE
jgi:hypothetical protein